MYHRLVGTTASCDQPLELAQSNFLLLLLSTASASSHATSLVSAAANAPMPGVAARVALSSWRVAGADLLSNSPALLVLLTERPATRLDYDDAIRRLVAAIQSVDSRISLRVLSVYLPAAQVQDLGEGLEVVDVSDARGCIRLLDWVLLYGAPPEQSSMSMAAAMGPPLLATDILPLGCFDQRLAAVVRDVLPRRRLLMECLRAAGLAAMPMWVRRFEEQQQQPPQELLPAPIPPPIFGSDYSGGGGGGAPTVSGTQPAALPPSCSFSPWSGVRSIQISPSVEPPPRRRLSVFDRLGPTPPPSPLKNRGPATTVSSTASDANNNLKACIGSAGQAGVKPEPESDEDDCVCLGIVQQLPAETPATAGGVAPTTLLLGDHEILRNGKVEKSVG